ncbi:hypothetical protein DSUL_20367 [Desulfovibrionales bacterium]
MVGRYNHTIRYISDNFIPDALWLWAALTDILIDFSKYVRGRIVLKSLFFSEVSNCKQDLL